MADAAYKTEQEKFWAGEFGDDYIERNSYENRSLIASNINLFSKVISRCSELKSVIEFGANIGLNLIAIKELLPSITDIRAVEINQKAADMLESRGICQKIYRQSILDFVPEQEHDLVLIKGVCIHLNPEWLDSVYDTLYKSSSKYICVAEYYNPSPVTVQYRGNSERLYKRDFAGELMDRYPDLELVDYGFQYHRDRQFPMDDISWFLLKKNF